MTTRRLIVEPRGLERANGQMWGVEIVANSFVGPPLGSLLIGVAFSLPFFFDAGTFAVAAALVWLISGVFRADGATTAAGTRVDWRGEIAEGFRYARIWGERAFDGQQVGRDHVVVDGDVVEIHT